MAHVSIQVSKRSGSVAEHMFSYQDLQALPEKNVDSKVPCQDLQVPDGRCAVEGAICHSSSAVECS